jgi:hypothetical protein
MQRREFIQTAGMITGLLAASGRAWAVDLGSLTTAEGTALMAMARTIAPHDKLEDAAYAVVIKAIDGAVRNDASLHKLLQDGVKQLPANFARADETTRVTALQRIEQTPFFQTMRVQTLLHLYSSPIAYAYFGFEGETFSKGGYLARGFNDLRWLPEVPLADSGPVPGA